MMQSVGPAAFINYPFIPESVALLANYTRTANELGMVCSVPTHPHMHARLLLTSSISLGCDGFTQVFHSLCLHLNAAGQILLHRA